MSKFVATTVLQDYNIFEALAATLQAVLFCGASSHVWQSHRIAPEKARPWRSTDLVSKTTHRSGIGCRPWAYAGLPEFNPVPGRRDEVVTHQSNPILAPG